MKNILACVEECPVPDWWGQDEWRRLQLARAGDRTVLATLAIGDVLDVVLIGAAPPEQTIEVLTRPGAATLGSVTSRWQELRNCLQAGFEFEAELRTTAGPVNILIRPKSA
jgi:hypothetical protein